MKSRKPNRRSRSTDRLSFFGSTPKPRRSTFNTRKLRVEQLEERRVLATYNWNDAANTLAITLAQNEDLTISEAAGTVSFNIDAGTFNFAGGDVAPGDTTNTIAIANANLATSITVNNTAAAAGTNNVTFNGGTIATASVVVNANQAGTTSAIDFATALTTFGTAGADSVSLTANGAGITDSTGSVNTATNGVAVNLSAVGQAILLDNPANDFGSTFAANAITAGSLSIADSGAIAFGALSISGAATINASLTIFFDGAATVGGNLVANTANNIDGNLGSLVVTGTSTLTASAAGGVIDLDGANNDFGGDVTVNAGLSATLNDINSLSFGGGSLVSGNLIVTAAGAITDTAGATIAVTGVASFSGSPITLDNAAAHNFGSLTFNSAGAVTITENSATVLTGTNTAASLLLTSTGSITDAANTDIAVTNNASYNGTSIALGENALDVQDYGSLTFTSAGAVVITEDSATSLSGASTAASLVLTSAGAITDAAGASLGVTGNASFAGTSITISAAATANFGSLTFNSAGAVSITEDSDTQISGANTANSLALTSAGAITDAADTDIAVTGNASFNGTSILIGENALDVQNYGSLTFTSAGAVVITEDSATSLSGASTAASLVLTSAGAITDAAGASLAVTGNASFAGTSITISAAATANFGSLTFNSAGAVSITEDSDTQISGANTANSLALTSAGAITDAVDTDIAVTNNASYNGTSIALGENALDVQNYGSLSFNSTGTVSIAEDSATAFAGTSTGTTIVVTSAGAMTDAEADAANEITGTALSLIATGGIGLLAARIHVNVTNLDLANATSGGIFVTDTGGGVTLTNLTGANAIDNGSGGAAATGGGSFVQASSPLTFAANALTNSGPGNTMTYTADDAAAAGDDMTVNAAVTVQDTTGSITLNVGDNLLISTTSTVRAAQNLTINLDTHAPVPDPGVGSTASIFGTIQSDTAGITITGNADNDIITIDNNGAAGGGTLDGVVVSAGQLFTINGGGGSDTLTLEDGSDVTGDTYTITATTISTAGGNLFNNAPGLNYSNLETINIQNSNGPTNADGDAVTVTSLNAGTTYNVDGNNPIGLPGDRLILNPPGAITVYEIGGNYVFEFPGSGNLVATEFETIDLMPGNGILNIIGDEGQGTAGGGAGTDEVDKITVVGTGVGAGTLQLSHNAVPIAIPPSVIFSGVTRLNVNTFESADGLAITPYADNTPQGWGVETYFNEGAPVLDGDLLIYNGVLGVSETIVVQPSASQAGQVFANNAATGTPIAVINYVLNVNIIVNGSSPAGTAGDTDSLTLRGTNPDNPGTSGQDTFIADFTNTGVPGDEKVVVTDTVGGAPLYSLQNFSNFSTINIESLAGADSISVTTVNGLTVNVDGGLPAAGAAGVPSDLLTVNTPASATITQGADSTTGQVLTAGGAVVNFAAVEAIALVSGDGGTLTVNATDDNDTIAAAEIGGADLVWVNDGPVIAFVNFTALTLNGRFGDDSFSISPTGLAVSAINVNGGDPTASDTVIVNGTTGLNAVTIDQLTIDGARVQGLGPVINITTAEHLAYNGLGGNDALTHTAPNNSLIDYFPGVEVGAGVISTLSGVGLLDVSFESLGTSGSLTFASSAGGRANRLDYHGTATDDLFRVSAAGLVELLRVPSNAVDLNVNTPGVAELVLIGLEGDDTFNIAGNHPFPGIGSPGITVQGGDPSASDVLNFTSSGGNVTVNFATSTVTEPGFAPVSFSGVETLNVSAGGADLTVLGTANDDHLIVTPDATVATTRLVFNNTTVNANNLDEFFINGVSGDDTLTVNATAAANTVDVTGTFVDITIPNRQRIDYLNFDALRVLGSAGSDTFNVTPAAATSIFIDGGDPIGVLPGDVLNIVGGGAATFQPGPEADEGGVSTVGNQPISFDHIESVSAGGPGGIIINGTNGNDVITIIARDASTHVGADGIQDFTVSVNNGPSVLFLNTPVVTVNALAGDDIITVRTPAPNNAVWAVTVNIDGGEALPSVSGERDEVRVETPYVGDETAIYLPSGLYSGSVIIADLGTVISMTDVFASSYDGFQDGDDLIVATTNAVIEPGSDPGSGVIHPVDVAGNPLLDLTYRNVSGVGSSVTVSGTTAVVQGTDENDIITVSSTGIVTVTNELGFNNVIDASGFVNLVINALGGDDQITIAANAPFVTIDVLGGDNGDGSDELNYNGAAGVGLITVETDLKTVTQTGQAVVSFDGIEDLNIDAALNPVDINGSLDDDSFIVRPNDATGAEVQQVGLNTIIQVNNTLDLEIDGDNGAGLENTLTIVATAGNDQIILNANQIAVAGRLAIQYSDIQALRVEGRAGTDRLTVDVTAGFPTNGGGNPIPITFDGQDGLDTLVISGVPTQPVDEVIYGPGPLANTGRVRYENAANTTLMTIDFVNLEPVIDLVAAANLTVNGTNADNAINYSLDEEIVNDVAIDTGLVSVDGFETIEFANKTNLNLNGLSGSDVINLGALGTPAGLTTVNVDGGDPTESDQLIVNGLFGGSTIDFAPTAGDGGSVSVSTLPITNYIRTELVTYVGRSGGDLLTVTSPAGGAEITYVPGATMDSGTITQVGVAASSSLTPFEFRDLGVLSTVTFATTGGARSSGLDIEGTNNDDAFNVNPLGHVQVVKANLPAPVTPTILTPGVAVLRLLGLNGDDIFNVPGVHPITLGIFVEGGDPSASDVLNFTAAAAPVAGVNVNLATQTVIQTLPVDFTGIEILNVIASGQALSVTGTANDDDVTVTVASATSGTIEIGYAVQQNGQVDQAVGVPVINYSGLPVAPANALAIDLAGGEDTLVVVGNALNQTFDVNVPAGSVAIDDGPVVSNDGLVTFTNTESLSVFGLEGNDTFNVTPGLIPVFVDGGDPIGEKAPFGGDTINVVGAILYFPGPEVDEGGFVAALAETVSFDHIENIGPIVGSPCVIILGTNGDDDITVIARDASYNALADGVQDFTVSVNGGPDILYIDVTMLFIDGLNGDDDIVLRTPAPNNAVWDVDVFVAGGPPSAATGDQGDVFELETPGTQAVVFTPTGSDSGTILIDGNDDGIIDPTETLITLGTFFDACPPLNYDSSPGGIELFVYEGETGGDALTVVGDDSLNERFIHTPGSAPDAGRVDIHLGLTARLGVTYQNLGALGTIEIYGGGALPDFDTVVAMGTGDSDSMALDFLAINEAEITLSSAAGTYIDLITEDIEFYELRTLEGDDTIRIQAPITVAVGGNVSVFAGGPGGSDVLLLSGDAATVETVTISPDATNPLDQDVNGLGALINVSGVELLRYTGATGNGPNDTLIINPGAGDHWLRVDNAPTSGDRVLSDSLPEIQFDGLLTFRIIEGGTGNIAVTFVTRNLNGAANYETDLGAQDTLIIEGDDGAADDYTVIQDIATGDVVITDNAFSVSVRDLDTNVGRLQINTLGGDDDLLVNVDGPVSGAIAVPLTYDGGLGSDLITISGTPTNALGADTPFTSVTYTPGPAVTEGRLAYDGLIDMLIDFLNLEPVIDLVGALSLIVNGTNANNAINYSQGSVAANGLVSVDGFETIEFSNKTTLVLNGLAGDDVVNLNNPNTPTGLTSITVNGGDPTASDTVIVNGTAAVNAITVDQFTADGARITGAQPVIVQVATTEHLTINGLGGGDNLTVETPDGLDLITVTPGALADQGQIDMRRSNGLGGSQLLSLDFTNLNSTGTLNFTDALGGREDHLTINGTEASNRFDLITTPGFIELATFTAGIPNRTLVLTSTAGVNGLSLEGLSGDDAFNIPGNHPFTGGIFVDAGNPSASDVLNYTAVAPAPAAAVALNLATATITQVGFGPVVYSGVEVINLNANGQSLGVTATANDDDLTVTVFSATSGKIEIGYAVQQNGQVDQGVVAPLINYSGLPVPPTFPAAQTNALAIDLAGGEDTLIVVGNALTQTFVVNASGAPFDPPVPAPLPLVAPAFSVLIDDLNDGTNNGLVTYSNNESLAVFGLEGTDGFFVAGADDSVPVFVDGGDPIGVGAPQGDFISVTGAAAFFVGPEPDEGGFFTAGGAVSYDHIERIGPIIVIPGCPFLIVGTNADDDITVIARDVSTHAGADGIQDFTVSVNAGPDLLLLDTPDLFIDALSGDDDIVIRAPAPNDADWNVHVRVAGGPPSIGEPNDGDRLVLETPGLDSMFYTPTGPDTGSLLIDEGGVAGVFDNGDTLIEFGPFVFVCPPAEITYISSPGGVELVEYDGELPVGGLTATDDITINGTAFNDTTTVTPFGVGPGGSGQGNFVSPGSPLFNFRGFDALTVNGGTGGFDHVIYNATEGPDVITSDADSILLLTTSVTLDAEINKLTLSTLGGDDNVNLDLTIGGVNLAKTIDAGAGNDTVDLSGSIDADIFGGIGNDILIGSPASDNIFGGDGNDRIVGSAGDDFIYGEAGNDIIGDLFAGGVVNGLSDDGGNDFFYGGDGSDLFIWEPGDGNDTIEGGANESDRVLFQGNAAGTAFTFNAGNGNVGGTRVEFLFGAGVDLDIAGVEEFDLNTLAGADTVTVNDLTQTDLRFIDIDLFVAAGDADSVIVNGRAVSDQVDIAPLPAPNGAIVAITGLAYDIRISGATAVAGPGGDLLTFNGNAGNDTIVSNDALNTLFAPEDVIINGGDGDDFISGFGTLNGDAGNDSLLGGAFVNVINGGAGNDFISGGGGGDDLNGDAGEDTFLADFDGVLDSYDGGTEFDTILIQATSGNDRIDAIQDNPTQIRFNVSGLGGGTGVVGGAGTQADALVEVGGVQTVEELKIVAGSGDDTIRVAHADSLVVAGFANDMLRFTVDGGLPGASDRLTVSDLGAGDTTVHRVGGNAGDGSYTMYSFLGGVPAAGIVALPPVVYTGIEFASLNPIDPVTGGTGAAFDGRLFVFKHDPFEENNSRLNATHLGANDAINVDPVIDPGPDVPFNLPGDEDWYRVVAQTTGTLDFQVYFREQGTLPNGRAGLPGEGDLQLFAYDAQGELIPGFGGNESTVGVNDADERIRIPVVAGQTYYFRLNGAADAINIYNLTVLNEAPPIPYDLELDDRIVAGAVAALGTTTTFNSNLDGQFPDDFFNGKVVSFKFDTTTVGIRGEEAVVLDYVGATGVFTLAFALSQAPTAGDTFQVESIDTGRSNTDNITRDNTPIIYLRLDDAIFLHDLPGNPVNDTPPDQVIPIPFNPQQTADPTAPGFRVAIFDEGLPTQPGQLPQVPIGYARQVAEGIYVFDFGIDAINPAAPNGPTTSRVLADGSHFLSAKVQIADPNTNFDTVLDDVIIPIDPFTVGVQPPTGFGDRSVSLEINVDTVVPPVSFGDPGVVGDGLTADSDSFVLPNPHTIGDGVTNDLTPTFWGRAEADATVRLFVDTYRDLNGDGDFDFTDINGDGDFDLGTDIPIDLLPDGVFQPNLDVFIGQTTAIPLDGNQQEPNGFWKIESVINFNDPAFFATLDGLRTVFVTAEDVAGNVNDNVAPQELDVFIDTQGPQITDVEINNVGNPYDLFDPKPSNDGPTPLINSIFVSVRDLPIRVAPEFLIPAIKEDIAENPGHYLVVGDYNGIIPILAIDVINLPVVPGQPAEATIEIIFRTEGPDGVFDTSDDVGIALPDDRFTLTINDEGIRDYANNILDGESNADEPHDQDNPVPPILGVDGVPTGDGIPGGDFIARFTVDSRPEMGVWAGGAAWIDTNGNTSFDPTNPDFTNRDITYVLGYTSDNLFAGNFAAEVDDPDTEDIDETEADGFDKLAAYGRVGTSTFRWLIDTDNDGVPDIERTDPANVNGYPVAGNFSAFSGDEVGLFAGTRWHFDTDHNFRVDTQIAWPVAGAPIVGDFDGDGFDDLATFVDDVFSVDLSSVGPAGAVAALNNGALGTGVNGTIERSFKFGFIGVGEKPVAADMNQDGIEDIGLWVPQRDGVTPGEGAEWYFLISGITANNTPPAAAAPNPAIGNPIGPTITGTGDPTPGNYDVSGSGFYEVPTAPGVNPNYANGRLVKDALFPGTNVVRFDPSPFGNDLFMQFGNEFALPILGNFDPPVSRSAALPLVTNPRDGLDVNNDGHVTAADALIIIDHLNAHGTTQAPTSGFVGAPFMDIDGNRFISPADALLVIDRLNAGGGEGEGEAADAFFGELGADQGEGEGEDLLAMLALDAMAQKKKK